MNDSARTMLAVVLAALVGGGVLIVLLPLGDACSFKALPGVNCARESTLERYSWNTLAVLIPVLIGAGAALLAGSRRRVAGLVAAPLAITAAHFGARELYMIEVPDYTVIGVTGVVVISGVLGLIGAYASGYLATLSTRLQRRRDG